ncbi:hypothetical protein [Leptospira wolffii]|uniref:hypothetical protein n=1 Tax=Leptospira wolffii TaxID=409998 RepID=UPI0012EBD58B|nr:hypothetical protein [Leptospira wolffii]
MAPILFLQFEKLFAFPFGYTEYGLRLFPLVSFWICIPLMYNVAELIFKNRKLSLYATLLFCLTPSLIYYASEAKQYMLDCLSYLLLTFLTLREYKSELRRILWISALGVILLPLSNITPIVLFCIGILLGYQSLIEKRFSPVYLLIPAISWAFFFGAYYILFLQSHPSKSVMLDYWKKTFLPSNPLQADFWLFLGDAIGKFFGGVLYQGPFGIITFGLYVFGILRLLKSKNVTVGLLLLLPIFVHLAISSFQLYPVDLRFLLYLVPPVLMVSSFTLLNISEKLSDKRVLRASILSFFPILSALILTFSFPFSLENVRKSLEYVSKHALPGDKLYVYTLAESAFIYYNETGRSPKLDFEFIPEELKGNSIELQSRSGRIWLLYSHLKGAKELEDLKKELETRGKRIDGFAKTNSGVELIQIEPKLSKSKKIE